MKIKLIPLVVYHMEFDKSKWSCSYTSNQNCAQNSARDTFYLSKTGPRVIIFSQISSKFKGEVVFYRPCMSSFAFLVSVLSVVQDYRST